MLPVYSAFEFALITRHELLRRAEKKDDFHLTDISSVSNDNFVAVVNGRRYVVIVEELGPPEG